jgi:outer membrane lipoprotein-sorting protein
VYRARRQAQEAERAIRSLGAVYGTITAYQDTAVVTQDMQMEGAKVAMDGEIRMIFQRPNKLYLTAKMRMPFGQTEVRVIGDGQTVWGYLPAANQYVVRESPGSLGENLQRLTQIATLDTIPLTLYGILLSQSRQEALARRARDIRFLRMEEVGGKSAYVVTWNEDVGPPPRRQGPPRGPPPSVTRFPVTAWVSQEDGLVLRWMMDLSNISRRTNIPSMAGGVSRSVSVGRLVVTLDHTEIRLNPVLPEDTFTFTPPPDAKRVEDFDAATVFYANPSPNVEPRFDKRRLAQLVPPRSPQARRALIDLSAHYTAPLTQDRRSDRPSTDLSGLPQGVQTLGGGDFDVRGVVQLAGRAEPYPAGAFPTEVRGIPIGLKCRRLHFLHGTAWSAPDGTQVGHYVMHFANGQTRAFPVLYGYDVRDWLVRRNEPAAETTGAAVAWTGSGGFGGRRRLYRSTWENPLPDVEITSVDYLASMADPAPFLIAITAE